MTRAVVLTVCAVIQTLLAVAAMAQAPVAQSKPKTITATIEAIDQVNRVVTLKGPKGNSVDVKAPDQMEGFKSLKVGDQVTATYFNALAVRIRKPGEAAPAEAPATTTTRKEGTPGSETRREQTFTVTVESVDPAAPSVTVKGPEGRVVTLAVSDPKTLANVKAGDTVDVTYYESLLVKFTRPKKKD